MGCIASMACCACSCLSKCCCKAAGGGDGERKPMGGGLAKVVYLFILVLMVLLGIAARLWSYDIFENFYAFDSACEGSEHCISIMGAYRISFAIFAFFILMALFTRGSRGFHTGVWPLKIIVLLVLTVGMFFVPNDFFDVYSSIARVGSVFFILLQLLILLDFAFEMHEYITYRAAALDAKLDAEGFEANICGNCWRVLYVFLSIGSFLLSFVSLLVMFFILPLCGLNIAYLSSTLLLGLLYSILSVTSKVGKGLLPAGVVWMYCTFLCWTAIRANPDLECNESANDSDKGSIALGVAIAVASLTWTAFRTASSGYEVLTCGGGSDSTDDEVDMGELERERAHKENEALTNAVTDAKADGDDGDDVEAGKPAKGRAVRGAGAAADDDDEDDGVRRGSASTANDQKFWFFHIIMAAAGMYAAMLLTNWGDATSGELTANTELSEQSMWVKIGSGWLCAVAFIWILIAPFVCAGREFA